MEDLNELLGTEFVNAPIVSEAEYLERWLSEVETPLDAGSSASNDADAFALALRGGMLADRFAWVFIAGYQAALRVTFPRVQFKGWAAFAVSEDRSVDSPLPGVFWHAEQGQYRLRGYKTWVAAIDHVQQLVVKARGEQAGQSTIFLVDSADSNVLLSANPAPGRLPDLSQGRAQLQDVLVGLERKLDQTYVAGFAQAEALYIYTAFLGMAYTIVPEYQNECRELLVQAQQIDPYQVNTADLARFDAGVQALRRQLDHGCFAQDQQWQRDQQLIGMYSKGIQARAA